MDDQMVEDVARAIAPYSFDPNRFWSALLNQSSEEVRDTQQDHVRDLARKAIAVTGVVDLNAALSAAQDEIEKLKGERDRARDLAVRSGVFTDGGGPLYALTPDDLGGAS